MSRAFVNEDAASEPPRRERLLEKERALRMPQQDDRLITGPKRFLRARRER